MGDVKRYVLMMPSDRLILRADDIRFENASHGEWVKHDDHAAALAEKDAEIERLEGLLRRCVTVIGEQADKLAREGIDGHGGVTVLIVEALAALGEG